MVNVLALLCIICIGLVGIFATVIFELKKIVTNLEERLNYYIEQAEKKAEEDEAKDERELSEVIRSIWEKPIEPESEEKEEELEVHLITPTQFLFDKIHDKYDLIYKEETNELIFQGAYDITKGTYDDFVIDNVFECIGDGLNFFGMYPPNANLVFVRNHKFGADFRITKV